MDNFVPYLMSQEYTLSLSYSKKQTMSLIKVFLIKQTGCIRSFRLFCRMSDVDTTRQAVF